MKSSIAVLAILLAASGCAKKEAQAQSREPAPPALTIHSAEIAPPDAAKRPVIFLHGMCADPKEDLDAWGHVAERHGKVIPVEGDVPCPDKPGQLKWSMDVDAIDAKIDSAVKSEKLEPVDMIVIGESMGAARAEMLAAKFPEKYSRLVLVGSPQTPSAQKLKDVKAVANLAGEKEPQSMMKSGTRALENAGTSTRFWELPEATHGNYGPQGERIMNEAIDFVASR